jgi:hypothetical protein
LFRSCQEKVSATSRQVKRSSTKKSGEKKMKKLNILIIGLVLLFGVSVDAKAQSGTQIITLPGNYRITVRGADGGSDYTHGGSGATVAATFALQASDRLTGVSGIQGAGGKGGGGGGGSAVILTRGVTKTLLMVAGAGGGGSAFDGDGGGGNSAQGTASGGGSGGKGGGGGGYNADGADTDPEGGGDAGGGKQGTLNGGGGGGFGDHFGGFGFGGGGGSCCKNDTDAGGGGGGGYGGGNGGGRFGGGGGGSSYVAASGTNITRTDGETGDGSGQNGSISVAPVTPSAASVSIGGRVTTPNGRGIMNVRLTLTDSSGQIRTATTTSLGDYRFDDVEVGDTYILSATGKRYTFSQPVQILNINEETTEVNFIANSEKRRMIF